MLPRSSTKEQVGSDGAQLRPPPHGPRCHRRSGREIVERPPDQRVGRVAAGGERTDHQGFVGLGRKILGRVHGGVGATVQDGLLHLLDEHALPTDHVQRDVLAAIAGRLDEHELDDAAGGA